MLSSFLMIIAVLSAMSCSVMGIVIRKKIEKIKSGIKDVEDVKPILKLLDDHSSFKKKIMKYQFAACLISMFAMDISLVMKGLANTDQLTRLTFFVMLAAYSFSCLMYLYVIAHEL